MDADRFDRLARILAAPASRRGALVAALALLAAGPPAAMALASRSGRGPGCVPDCAARDCGDDGCGGSCGACPPGSACIDALGFCSTGDCPSPGDPCVATCNCQLLICVNGFCAAPECRQPGETCGPAAACCANAECIEGLCVPVAPTCTPTGADCSREECCEPDDTCLGDGAGAFSCVPTPPFDPGCTRAGKRPGAGGCCPRLHAERGRCVINRWDRCGNRGNRRRGGCERGCRCRRLARGGKPICVPKG